jgi:hypothetical protein
MSLLFKVLWSPAEVMFLVSKTPRVLAPLLFLFLFSMGAEIVVMTKVDTTELTMRALEKTPQGATLSDDAKDQRRQGMNSPTGKALWFASTLLTPMIVILIVASLYFALFTILGREAGFKSFLSVTAFAFIPQIFRELARVVTAFVIPGTSITLDEFGSISPSLFIARDSISPAVFVALNTIDLVSIWILILLAIGYGFVTSKRVSKRARAGAVVGVFLGYVILRLGIAVVLGA